jgi:MFS family permease
MQLKTTQDLAYGISGLLTASVGYLILLFLPVYLEVVALSLSLSEQEVGRLASTDSAGIVVATILFASFVSKLNFRKVAFLGVLISVVGNLLSGVVDSFYLLCLVRLVCGVGEGLLVAVGISALGMTSSPNRWFGYYTAAVVIVQAIGLAAVPLIYQSSGLFFVFFAIAIFYMLPLVVLKKLPKDSNVYGSVVTESKPSYLSKRYFGWPLWDY